ncbi:hypothetical protein GOP47_0028498 [Adiantum capillus-veneris]|nr:hypothetical protein GOP47_0028498 [Adiantum capillus-veneris]
MLMDVGHRLLSSLRQVDSCCRSVPCNPPRTLLFTAHLNSISSRYYWHGSQKAVSDDKLMNVLGEILRFGAALNSWRSWASRSEHFTVRCTFHRSMGIASTEAREIQGENPSTETREGQNAKKNDQCQTDDDQQGLLKQANGETSSWIELTNQLESMEFSNVNVLPRDSSKEDSLPSGLNDALVSNADVSTDIVVIVFDIETTGFKLSDDRIIEFAARDLAGGDYSTIQTLVNPERPIPLHATNVHGIHSYMVNKENIPRWKEVAPVLTKFVESRRISGGPVFLVAHNGKRFDVPFLMKEFNRCSLQIPSWWQFVDSVPIAREVMKAKGEKGPLRLSALYEYYKLPYVGEAHRALADVDMLASVLQMLLLDLKMSLSDFLKKAFTTKDILQSSSPIFDNLESLPQDFDLSSELSMEGEDLSEVSCVPHELSESSDVPWDDIEGKESNERPLMLEGMDSKKVIHEKSKQCVNINAWPERSMEKNDMCTSRDDSSITDSVWDISPNHGVVYDCNDPYRILELADIDTSLLSSTLNEYLLMKSRRPELLLLWKSGGFYQAFFEDAKKLSEVCNVGLSAIKGGEFLDGLVSMASLHSEHVDVYIQALLAKGIGVCKQDLAGRMTCYASSQLLTPGTARIPRNQDDSLNSFLLAVVPAHTDDDTWGLAYTEVLTGEIRVTEGQGPRSMIEEILTVRPSEILCSADVDRRKLHSLPFGLSMGYSYSFRPSGEFCSTYCKKKLLDFFDFDAIEQSGLETLPVATCAVGGLLGFLEDIQCSLTGKLTFHKISSYHPHDYMLLDQCTRRCLELFKTKQEGQLKGSLFCAINLTRTPMGKRLLRQWLLRPLLDKELICLRQDAVEVFVHSPELLEKVRLDLSRMNDLERLAGDVVSDHLSPWDLLAMGQSIRILQTLRSRLEAHLNPYFGSLRCDINLLKLGQKLQNYIDVGASSIIQAGYIVKEDADEALNELRKEIHTLDASLKDFEKLERDRTGLSSLKLMLNEEGDHYVSVKKQALENIPLPADYQFYSSGTSEDIVCFVSTSLLQHNKRRSELMKKLRHKEASVLELLRSEVCAFIKQLQMANQAVAAIDVLASFAEVAVSRQYCKPAVSSGSRLIKVTAGRHPVAELQRPKRELFNANSLKMGYQPEMDKKMASWTSDLNSLYPEQHRLCPDVLILTGPPASGKSCFLQQAGLIQLLAQIGSYVPAKEAVLGIADTILMKAEDLNDVSTGRSCFELQMDRFVNILQNATSQSLILLDGIDRGLSLNDDGAVTRAIVEYLAQNVKSRTMLTTHNTNLGSLEEEFLNVANFQCMNDIDTLFSYCVKPGFYFESSVSALDKIDGLPKWISIRATQLLSKDDTSGEKACPLEQKLNGNNVTSAEPVRLVNNSVNKDKKDKEFHELEQELLETVASMEKAVFEVQQDRESDAEFSLSRPHAEQLNSSSVDTSELASRPSSGVSEATKRVKDAAVRELNNTEALQETWQFVLQALEDYPATHALAKQKGILVFVKRSPEASEVHMTTSDLFLKKFLQQEHAIALENAFLTVLKSPIRLKLTVASEQK